MQIRFEIETMEKARAIQTELKTMGGHSQLLMNGRKYHDGAILEVPEHWADWLAIKHNLTGKSYGRN